MLRHLLGMLRFLLERLNMPRAVGVVLLAVFAINGLLFYLSKQGLAGGVAITLPAITVGFVAAIQEAVDSLQEAASAVAADLVAAVQGAADSLQGTVSQEEQSTTALILLVALVILTVVNVVSAVVATLTLRSVRKSVGLSESPLQHLPRQSSPMDFLQATAFSYEERLTIIEEKHNLETEQRIDELKEEILGLRQAYRQLAEGLERVEVWRQESYRERERIVEGLQHMRKILEERAASSR